jgi:GNAT superfamily N-acetyltransferase
MSASRLKLAIQPLTPERWPDFEQLFGPRGACGGCWCMFWRLSRAEFQAGKGAGNRSAMKQLVTSGGIPGLLAYDGNRAIGWCALAPRTAYSALQRSRLLKPLDDKPVWSISCLFVARTHRRKGISIQLLEAAVAHARAHGGRIVEGYPQEARKGTVPDVFAWTGLASAFRQAGFKECARPSPTRPIMRFDGR